MEKEIKIKVESDRGQSEVFINLIIALLAILIVIVGSTDFSFKFCPSEEAREIEYKPGVYVPYWVS